MVSGPGKTEIELNMPSNQLFYKNITVKAIKTPQSDMEKDDLIKNRSIKNFNKKESFDAAPDPYEMNQFYEGYEGDGKSFAFIEHVIIDLNNK
jgi:hypothetical protein